MDSRLYTYSYKQALCHTALNFPLQFLLLFVKKTFIPFLWEARKNCKITQRQMCRPGPAFWQRILILIVKKTPLHKKPHLDHEKTTVTTCCLSLFEYLNCSPFSSTLYFPNTFPVNIAEGPQGSEYAVNMYRIFQHKLFSLNNKVYYAYVRV